MVGDVDPHPRLLTYGDGLFNVFHNAGSFASHVDGKDAVFLSRGPAEGNQLPAVAEGRRGIDYPCRKADCPFIHPLSDEGGHRGKIIVGRFLVPEPHDGHADRSVGDVNARVDCRPCPLEGIQVFPDGPPSPSIQGP